MILSEKKRFAAAFQTMCEVFDRKSTKIMLAGYFKALERFSVEDVESAISQAIGTCRYFPKPVELIEMIPGGKPLALENKAEIEVDKILCHFRQYGATRWPDMSDPITKHLMTKRWHYQRWGRRVLESELTWWKKEFIAAYQAYSESGVKQIEFSEPVMKLVEGIGG